MPDSKSVSILGCFLLFAGCHVADQAHDPAEDEAAIRALARQGLEAENNEDLESFLNLVTDDAVVLTAEGPVKGKDAIRKVLAASFAELDWEEDWTLEEVEISGDLAVMWGPIELKQTLRQGGDSSHSTGYHLDVARRLPDGSWKFTWWTTAMKPVPEPAVE